MNFPTYKPGPVDNWLAEAGTQFVNGFIAGWRHGVGTGAGTGILTGTQLPAESMTKMQQIVIAGGATVFAMFMSGINAVSSWHENGHPFPNPWPQPPPATGNTPSPFSPVVKLTPPSSPTSSP